VVQGLPTGYVFDPADPRAPAVDQWERMLPDERARVVSMLPAEGSDRTARVKRARR
jgi:hypothetical protein